MIGSAPNTAHPCGAVDGRSQSRWLCGPLVDELGRGATGAGEPVDADVGQQLVAVDGVAPEAAAAGLVHSLNFSTIHASWPTGESVRA